MKNKIGTSPSFPENVGQTYAAFQAGGAQTRTNVVYAGANDGLLHGFRSGAYNASNVYQPATNDGLEVLAYMPAVAWRSGTGMVVWSELNSFSHRPPADDRSDT